jgi:hypothetical protein
MKRHKAEAVVDMTGRLHHLEQLLLPRLVAPRMAPDDEIEPRAPLLAVEPHQGRMYVVGHEPHFRDVTLLQPVRPRHASGSDPA